MLITLPDDGGTTVHFGQYADKSKSKMNFLTEVSYRVLSKDVAIESNPLQKSPDDPVIGYSISIKSLDVEARFDKKRDDGKKGPYLTCENVTYGKWTEPCRLAEEQAP
jgi:hypothetical protein